MPHMEGELVLMSTLKFEVFSLIFRSMDNAELCLCGLQTLLLWTGRCTGWLPRWPKIFITDSVGTGFSNHFQKLHRLLLISAHHEAGTLTYWNRPLHRSVINQHVFWVVCAENKDQLKSCFHSISLHIDCICMQHQKRNNEENTAIVLEIQFGLSIVLDPNKSLWEQKQELLLSRHKINL